MLTHHESDGVARVDVVAAIDLLAAEAEAHRRQHAQRSRHDLQRELLERQLLV